MSELHEYFLTKACKREIDDIKSRYEDAYIPNDSLPLIELEKWRNANVYVVKTIFGDISYIRRPFMDAMANPAMKAEIEERAKEKIQEMRHHP